MCQGAPHEYPYDMPLRCCIKVFSELARLPVSIVIGITSVSRARVRQPFPIDVACGRPCGPSVPTKFDAIGHFPTGNQ